jgi:glycosyltransferase involved in cell wall biosynthesis
MSRKRPLRIGFAPWLVAGVKTQWENMLPTLLTRDDIEPVVAPIDPYRPGGWLERMPGLPPAVTGNIRTLASGTPLAAARLDALWTQNLRAAVPRLCARGFWDSVPLVYTADSTAAQQAALGRYYAVSDNDSLLGRLRNRLDRRLMSRVAIVNPWSDWAAESFRSELDVPPGRIRVLPPGIDLERWPKLAHAGSERRQFRILFVGGDFARKGGDLLLSVIEQEFLGRCELHLVTRDPVAARPGVVVHHGLSPNDPVLRQLYADSDVFVLPTRADCFSLASLEAMATGLPVITTRVGGIVEIVRDGSTGFLIDVDDSAQLAARLNLLLSDRDRCVAMGHAGRALVERDFDAARNTGALLDMIVEAALEAPRREDDRR